MKRRWTVAHAKPSRNLALTSFTRSRLGQRSEKRILVIEPMQDANQPKISPQTLRDFPLAGASLAGKDASSLKRTSAKLTAAGLRSTRPRIAILTAPPGATHPLDRTTGPRPATPPRIQRRPCAGASLQRAESSPRRKNGLVNATATFRTLSHRERRAVMGLSMGGGQAIRAGLGQYDLSASVGDCSAATIGDFTTRCKALLDDPTGTNAALQRLCIRRSRQDSLSASEVRPTFFRWKASTLTSSGAAGWRRPRRGSSVESATVRSCQFPCAGRRSQPP